MAGLLGDVLPWAYSQGDRAKRYLGGLLGDPMGSMQKTAGQIVDNGRQMSGLLDRAWTDRAAQEQATQMVMNGLLGFAPAGMTKWSGRPISAEEARAMVAGKTEKLGGTDPIMQINAGEGNGKSMSFGRVPLSAVRANEEGALYDGTVNAARALEYARRPPGDVPPVILVTGRRTGGFFNVLDGGHRISAARMRGDEDIPAIVMQRDR